MGGRKAEGDISAASTSVNRWRCGAGLPAMRPRVLVRQRPRCLKMRQKPKDICDLRMTPSRIAQDISRCTFLTIAGHTLMLRLKQLLDQLASERREGNRCEFSIKFCSLSAAPSWHNRP